MSTKAKRRPTTAKTVNHPLREQLATAIAARIEYLGLKQVQAAEMLGLTQPRLNLLLRGHIEHFSLDALANLASRAGLTVRLTVTRPYGQG
jgi:predicted XRE-type DNA-binding protein